MFDGKTVAFRLPCGTPALSVVLTGDGFGAVDGRESGVYLFSNCGRFLEIIPTARAYGTITKMGDGGYLALPRCSCRRFSNRVYFLNAGFEEVGSLDLQGEEEDCGELTDVFYTEGCEILATFRNSLKVFDLTGSQQDVMTDTSSRYLFNVAEAGGLTAVHHRRRWGDMLTVASEAGSETAGICGRLVLRDLIPGEAGVFYGLFGYRYQYNYLLPVYADGRIILPGEEDLPAFLQNVTPCS